MLQRNSSTPLYQQIAEILSVGIHSGRYKPGDKLPSENELCRIYSVSRMTVRLALSQLLQQGLIESIHGKGSFVRQSVFLGRRKIMSFSETLRRRGLRGRTVIESCGETEDASFAGECFNLNLLAFTEDNPFALYCSYMPMELGQKMKAAAEQGVREGRPFSSYELYQYLDQKPARVEQEFSAANADAELAALLKVSKGKAVLVVRSYYYDENDVLLEFKRAYYRPDLSAFCIQREV